MPAPGRVPSCVLAVLALCAPAIVACGGGDDEGGNAGGSEANTAGCEPAEPAEARSVRKRSRPTLRLSPDKSYTATVTTSCGTFEIELDSKQAPRTGGSFVTLARSGFYDGLSFHRIAPGFVIQGGDPKGDGTGGPGYSVREAPPDDVVYSEGVVAMAKTEAEPPGTSGSQFFVVTAESAPLDPLYAVLGRVTKGLEVVHEIERVPTTGEQPQEPVRIEKVEIREG